MTPLAAAVLMDSRAHESAMSMAASSPLTLSQPNIRTRMVTNCSREMVSPRPKRPSPTPFIRPYSAALSMLSLAHKSAGTSV